MPPLAVEEIQRNVSGAARLSRACLDRPAPSGLYIIRLFIDPSGRVTSATPRAAPRRAADPGRYLGVPRYLDAGPDPDNAVTRCLATALGKLHFHPFGGPTVGFDHPVVVDKLPPSETHSAKRHCSQDRDCVFLPRASCTCAPCGPTWRRAINRRTLHKLLKRRKRHHDHHACPHLKCKPCNTPRRLLGTKALCINGQCSVR